jgi:hypothetical protein
MKSIQTSNFHTYLHVRTLALVLGILIPQFSMASSINSKTLENESEDVAVPLSQTDVETTLNARLRDQSFLLRFKTQPLSGPAFLLLLLIFSLLLKGISIGSSAFHS